MPQAGTRQLSPRAPAPSKEAVGKPTVHLSSSPQAEVSHIAFQPGALHPNFLPPQQRQPRLALCLVPEHRGRRQVWGPLGWAEILDDVALLCEPLQPSDRPFPAL